MYRVVASPFYDTDRKVKARLDDATLKISDVSYSFARTAYFDSGVTPLSLVSRYQNACV